MKAATATSEAVELLTAALAQGCAVTFSLTAPPRVVRPPPLITICGLLFGLTPAEARVLMELASCGFATTEDLHAAMLGNGTSSKSRTISVVVYRIRRKLQPYGIEIETFWGEGYRLAKSSRDKLRERLAEYGAAGATTPPTDHEGRT